LHAKLSPITTILTHLVLDYLHLLYCLVSLLTASKCCEHLTNCTSICVII